MDKSLQGQLQALATDRAESYTTLLFLTSTIEYIDVLQS